MGIALKTRTKDHVKVFWEKTQDEEIKKVFPFSIKSLEDALVLFEESQKEGALSYGKVIYYKEQYIGDIWCYGIDESNERLSMISVVIFEKEMWGKGIGTEVVKDFVNIVFNKYDIDKIGAFTYSNNLRTIGLLKKVGFSKIETFIEDGVESMYFEIQDVR